MIPMKPYDSGSAPSRQSKHARRDWWVLLSIGLTFELIVAGGLTNQQGAVVGLIVGLLTYGVVWTVRRQTALRL
jgi:hypothetical protein